MLRAQLLDRQARCESATRTCARTHDHPGVIAAPQETPASGGVLDLSSYLLSRAGNATRGRLADHLATRSLRLWHVTVLAALDDHGPHSKGELAARLDINPADIGRTVDELARAGRVDCVRHPADRRRIEVSLTPVGRADLAVLNAELTAMDDELLSPLTAAERVQFAGLLRRLFLHIRHPGAAGSGPVTGPGART